jgi:hypothetical protein
LRVRGRLLAMPTFIDPQVKRPSVGFLHLDHVILRQRSVTYSMHDAHCFVSSPNFVIAIGYKSVGLILLSELLLVFVIYIQSTSSFLSMEKDILVFFLNLKVVYQFH